MEWIFVSLWSEQKSDFLVSYFIQNRVILDRDISRIYSIGTVHQSGTGVIMNSILVGQMAMHLLTAMLFSDL